ncbi:MAG: F0F1 ATP synthase subunit A [Polyangiaceae bacterium]
MPKHTGFLTYLLAMFPALKQNASNVGKTAMTSLGMANEEVTYRGLEPIFMSMILILLVIILASRVRSTFKKLDEAVVPDETLTLRTFFEAFLAYFYGMAGDIMGKRNAKRYFPLIGGAALFIFFSNVCSLIPGMNPPTASWNVTIGCALVVFIAFNYYGLKENGIDYVKHLAGWGVFKNPIASVALAVLMLPIELISTCVRPVTLSIRLMLNIAVDHLIGSIFLGLIALFVPVPLMFLALIVILVQTLVFCLLSSIYIGLATEKSHDH